MPAPAILHPCDVPCHSRHLVTPAAWSGGRKPAHGRRSCRSRDLADPGTAPRRLGSLTPARRKRRHKARRHIMPYQDAGQQSHQLATWAHSITQGRSPPVGPSLSSDQFRRGGFRATDTLTARVTLFGCELDHKKCMCVRDLVLARQGMQREASPLPGRYRLPTHCY